MDGFTGASKIGVIAVAEFGFDSHSFHKYDPAHPALRNWSFEF